jgi:HAD superfamily hydrolase (TIGR01509 family)
MTDLVIFDCDGVLVDSESIASASLAREGNKYGAEIGEAEALSLFLGMKMSECVAEIARRAGRTLPDTFTSDARAEMARRFAAELKAIDGIHDALAEISIPICVASNGPMFKMEQTLMLTGLHARFEGHIFSAYDVGAWKPDPGLFLHAAKTMGVAPSRCVVVEDSLPGVRAAKAAGIDVFGYTGGNPRSPLLNECKTLFDSMRDLPRMIRERAAQPC